MKPFCSLTNKIALVTGSSRGIGKAIAKSFLEGGASVVLNGKSVENLQKTEKEFCEYADRILAIPADVSQGTNVDMLFKKALERFGRVDILVNNAGDYRNSLLARMDEKEWDSVLENNLKSAYLCARWAARQMMKQKSGRIINISSVVALGGNPFQANYAASKAGLDGMTMALAKELAPYSVTVNSVAPGYILTDMTKGFSEAMVDEILRFIPLNRVGIADEVASTVRFLVSEEAGYITGQVIQVDGGRVIR